MTPSTASLKRMAPTILAALALPACLLAETTRTVLCTTFPIHHITRQVTEGREGLTVERLLPASLGCPHDVALTPQDMARLATADILVVNGLGMEEFLGAPVHRANPDLVVIDSSDGITGLLPYIAESTDEVGPYEWIGVFDLAAGNYTWRFDQVDGAYADPGMAMAILKANTTPAEAIASTRAEAHAWAEREPSASQRGDAVLHPGARHQLDFTLDAPSTTFTIAIEEPGTYVFFTEHLPFEFEREAHFFQDSSGRDIEPAVQEPEMASGHGHDHHHHHHHGGMNPHLFASPAMAAQLAHAIARQLSAIDPEGTDRYNDNATAFATRMEALHKELAGKAASLANRKVIQPHGIFDYLFRDLGIEIVASTQPHGQEPSAAQMIALIEKGRATGVGAVILEPQYDSRSGRTLARELGIPAIMLDPGASGPDAPPPDHTETIMRANLQALADALGTRE